MTLDHNFFYFFPYFSVFAKVLNCLLNKSSGAKFRLSMVSFSVGGTFLSESFSSKILFFGLLTIKFKDHLDQLKTQ